METLYSRESCLKSSGSIMPRVCFLLIFFMLLGQTFVSAQEDMSFSEEEVDEVRDASPVVKFLDEGTKYYEQKEYYQASLLFYKVIEEQDASATSLHPRAQYELAKSLYRLKFYQGSLSLFQ